MVKEPTNGLTVDLMLESGPTTCCTAKVHTSGQMARSTKETTSTIKSTATESALGPTAKSTLEVGLMGSSMAEPRFQMQKEKAGKESGKTENARSGSE